MKIFESISFEKKKIISRNNICIRCLGKDFARLEFFRSYRNAGGKFAMFTTEMHFVRVNYIRVIHTRKSAPRAREAEISVLVARAFCQSFYIGQILNRV